MSLKHRNVFQIAREKAGAPFFVRAYHWGSDSCFQVIAVRYTEKQMDYFKKMGKLYGTAEGYFYRKGQRVSGKVEELKNAGVYKWKEVLQEDVGTIGAGASQTSESKQLV